LAAALQAMLMAEVRLQRARCSRAPIARPAPKVQLVPQPIEEKPKRAASLSQELALRPAQRIQHFHSSSAPDEGRPNLA